MSRKTASPTKTAPKKATATKSAAKPSASKSGAGHTGRQAGIAKRPAAIDRSSQDLAAAIDTLHSQMNAAMARIAELATIQANHNKVVIRTAPLDRATATFQRIVAEVVDDQLSEMLPPLVALRNELAGRAGADGAGDAGDGESARRGCETLDHVLKIAGAQSYDARPGEPVDPVIHLAVGETSRGDLPAGVVAETVQPGFRTARGKVIVPAKVRVNRR